VHQCESIVGSEGCPESAVAVDGDREDASSVLWRRASSGAVTPRCWEQARELGDTAGVSVRGGHGAEGSRVSPARARQCSVGGWPGALDRVFGYDAGDQVASPVQHNPATVERAGPMRWLSIN
jgi:hypothetical protein